MLYYYPNLLKTNQNLLFIILYPFFLKATKELYIMKTAMREWEKYTCIKFREKTSSDVNFVRIQNGHGRVFFSLMVTEELTYGMIETATAGII